MTGLTRVSQLIRPKRDKDHFKTCKDFRFRMPQLEMLTPTGMLFSNLSKSYENGPHFALVTFEETNIRCNATSLLLGSVLRESRDNSLTCVRLLIHRKHNPNIRFSSKSCAVAICRLSLSSSLIRWKRSNGLQTVVRLLCIPLFLYTRMFLD